MACGHKAAPDRANAGPALTVPVSGITFGIEPDDGETPALAE